MGVTTQGWEASGQKDSYGLEPFVFDPGEVKTQAELVTEAQKRVECDKLLKQTVGKRKGEIVQVLQDCLDKVNDQLERGEDICHKAHFPLLHPFNFEDLEALAQHDFTIDIHADVIDKVLKDLVSEFMKVVWQNVVVEDVSKARMLERYNEALQGRMETLEYHLIDRSRQLSNCRFAYFLEITHLRNQVYIQGCEGDKFEPVEAYFFDPTDYLEEELRLQLNDKITLSVRKYHTQLQEAKRRIEDLEMQLEAAGGAWKAEKKHRDKLKDQIELLVVNFKVPRILHELNNQENREVTAWCLEWAAKRGMVEDTGVVNLESELTELKAEMKMAKIEMERLKQENAQHVDDLEEEKTAKGILQDEVDQLKALLAEHGISGGGGGGPVRPQRDDSADKIAKMNEEMDAMRKQIAMLKLDGEKALNRAREAEQKLASQAEAAEASRQALDGLKLQNNTLQTQAAQAQSTEKSPDIVINRTINQVAAAEAGASAKEVEVTKEVKPEGYDSAKSLLEDMYHQYSEQRSRADTGGQGGHFGGLGAICGISADPDAFMTGVAGGDTARSSGGLVQPGMRYDAQTEEKLEWLAAAIENGDDAAVAAFRKQLKAQGIDPDDALKSKKLDRLAAAIQNKDATAVEAIRKQLKAQGIDPDVALKSHKACVAGDDTDTSNGGPAQWQRGDGESAKRGRLDTIMGDFSLEDDLSHLIPTDGTANLHDYVQWSKALMDKKDDLLKKLEPTVLNLHEEVQRQEGLVSRQRALTDHFELEAMLLAEESAAARAAQQAAEADAKALRLQGGQTEAPVAEKTKPKFAASTADRVAPREGFFECDTQTQITGVTDAGFYLLEFPPSDAQLAMEMELEDLNTCAQTNWESTITQVRACQRPPLGYGSGYCPRSAFLRLFQGTGSRISRMDELIQMTEKLKRSELLRLMHGVHLLMESTLPNDDAPLREAIFGRGISESALLAAKTGTELMNLSGKWCSHSARIIDIILSRTDDIELGVHMDRRTFMVGGAGGGRGGGAGGGLAARERKDFSPVRQPLWKGVLGEPQGDEVGELCGISAAVYQSPRSRAQGMAELSLEGQEIPLYNLEGSTYGLGGFDFKNGPYIVVGGRLVPRRGVEQMTQHGYIAPRSQRESPSASRGRSTSFDTDLAVNAQAWRPDELERPIQRSMSPPNRAALFQRDDLGDSQGSRPMSAKNMSLPSMLGQTVTTAASTGDFRSPLGKARSPSPLKEEEQEGLEENEENEAASKVIARLRPPRGGPIAMKFVQATLDIEEPQAEPGPDLPRPQSGSMLGRGLRGFDRRAEREVERARRQICEASAGTCGPIPTWNLDQQADEQARLRPRTAGGSHTKVPQALKRTASASRIRSSAGKSTSYLPGASMSSSASAGVLSGLLETKAPLARPGTAPGVRSAAVGVRNRPGTASVSRPGAIGRMTDPERHLTCPVRVTSLPFAKTPGTVDETQNEPL